MQPHYSEFSFNGDVSANQFPPILETKKEGACVPLPRGADQGSRVLSDKISAERQGVIECIAQTTRRREEGSPVCR
jgi:hypothetical protein